MACSPCSASSAPQPVLELGSNEHGIGLFLTLQALVMVLLWSRALFFFRGFLALGALVHIVEDITQQILPFLFMLMALTTGFAAAISVLLSHAAWDGDDWSSFRMALFNSINMGFRYVPPRPATMSTHWQVVALYEFFMIIVQVP